MPAQVNADAAKGMNSVIQFKLTGDGGGNYYVEIKDGTAKVSAGHARLAEHDHDAGCVRTTST